MTTLEALSIIHSLAIENALNWDDPENGQEQEALQSQAFEVFQRMYAELERKGSVVLMSDQTA